MTGSMPSEPAPSATGTATVLFTDLVGSTELRARLGEEVAEALRRTHDRLLAEAVAGHHGTLVKSIGDGIMATFAAVTDAIAAAVTIMQTFDRHNRRAGAEPLKVRVGVSVGDVSWEGGDCFGTPVVEAARLCAAADGAQILVAELVQRLTHGRGGYRFTSAGEVALKGLPQPVAACTVAWEPVGEVAVPLPPRLATASSIPFVGRAVEQEVLALAWAKAKDGQRQVVLLAGELGIGKTRLATEAARTAHAENATVLLGTCEEDLSAPYRPFIEALRHYVTHAPDDVLTLHVRAHKGELVRLIPELAQRVPNLPPPQPAEAETERYLMFEAATALLAAASQRSPVMLVLEDLHWAGAPELLLLKHLVRLADPMRLLVVATYRDTDLSRTHPLTALLADLRREVGVGRLALRGLDDDAVVALVTAAAGHDLTDAGLALAHALQGDTEGNPLFIAEILRHLVESGALFRERGRWTYAGEISGLGIPESVREVIGRRVGRLSEPTRKLLGLAAVIGRQFDLALLARVAEASEDAVLDALEEATAAALLAEVPGAAGQVAFSHALIRTTLYQELGAARRARLHRRVGEALEELTAVSEPSARRIDELAHHWLAATQLADARKAIDYARQAGNRAMALLAYEEGARLYEAALQAFERGGPVDERQRCELLLALGRAQTRASDSASAHQTLQRAAESARRAKAPELLAQAALGFRGEGPGAPCGLSPDHKVLLSLLEDALSELPAEDSALRARLLGRQAMALAWSGSRERRESLSRQAVEMAARVGDAGTRAAVLGMLHTALFGPENVEERLASATEILRLAEETGDRETALDARQRRITALLELGDITAVDREIEAYEALASELRQPLYVAATAVLRAMRALMDGRFVAAEEFARQALQVSGRLHNQVKTIVLAQMFFLCREQGRLQDLQATMSGLLEDIPIADMPAARAGLAWTMCDMGLVAEARAEFEQLAANDFTDLPRDNSWLPGLATLSEVCTFLGDARRAGLLYELLRPHALRNITVVTASICFGPAAYYLGRLALTMGRLEQAVAHLESALGASEAMGARPLIAHIAHACAEARAARGEGTQALQLLERALAIAEGLAMRPLVENLLTLKPRVESLAACGRSS